MRFWKASGDCLCVCVYIKRRLFFSSHATSELEYEKWTQNNGLKVKLLFEEAKRMTQVFLIDKVDHSLGMESKMWLIDFPDNNQIINLIQENNLEMPFFPHSIQLESLSCTHLARLVSKFCPGQVALNPITN